VAHTNDFFSRPFPLYCLFYYGYNVTAPVHPIMDWAYQASVEIYRGGMVNIVQEPHFVNLQ